MHTVAGNVSWDNMSIIWKKMQGVLGIISLYKNIWIPTERIYRMGKENKDSTTCLDENYIAKMYNTAAKDEMV